MYLFATSRLLVPNYASRLVVAVKQQRCFRRASQIFRSLGFVSLYSHAIFQFRSCHQLAVPCRVAQGKIMVFFFFDSEFSCVLGSTNSIKKDLKIL